MNGKEASRRPINAGKPGRRSGEHLTMNNCQRQQLSFAYGANVPFMRAVGSLISNIAAWSAGVSRHDAGAASGAGPSGKARVPQHNEGIGGGGQRKKIKQSMEMRENNK